MNPWIGYIATTTEHGTLHTRHNCKTPDRDKLYTPPVRWVCGTCSQQWVLADAPSLGYTSRYIWARAKEPWPDTTPPGTDFTTHARITAIERFIGTIDGDPPGSLTDRLNTIENLLSSKEATE